MRYRPFADIHWRSGQAARISEPHHATAKVQQIATGSRYGQVVTTSNNPAGRLHNLLSMGRGFANPNHIALVAWTETLGYESPHGTPMVLRRGAEMIEMAADTRRRIERLPDDAGPSLLNHFGEVESTVNMFTNLSSLQMVQFMSPMKDTGWQCLQTFDWMLKREDPDPMLADDEVEALVATVSDLLDAVESSTELTVETKSFIVRHLEEIRDSLVGVATWGLRDAERAINITIGAIVFNPVVREEVQKTTIGKRVADVVFHCGSAIASAALSASATAALSSPSGQAALNDVLKAITGG